MSEGEPLEVQREIFKETLQDGLFKLDDKLDDLSFTSEGLSDEVVRQICTDLDGLIEEAKAIGEETRAEMLEQIRWTFHSLRTIGIVDNPTRFSDAESHVYMLVEFALLALDNSTQKNKGKALGNIKARRERNR